MTPLNLHTRKLAEDYISRKCYQLTGSPIVKYDATSDPASGATAFRRSPREDRPGYVVSYFLNSRRIAHEIVTFDPSTAGVVVYSSESRKAA